MATEVNPALPLRMLAVACVCLRARLRSPATLVAFVFLWRCRIADKSNLKVVCVCVFTLTYKHRVTYLFNLMCVYCVYFMPPPDDKEIAQTPLGQLL